MREFRHNYPVDNSTQQSSFSSPQAVRKYAARVQSLLLARLPAEYLGVPKYRLVQLKLVPSQKEIAESLLHGGYQEFQ